MNERWRPPQWPVSCGYLRDSRAWEGYRERMTARLDVVGIVVDDMARSLAFYRRLGFDLAAANDSEPHVEASLPGGLRIAWDTADTIG